MIHICHITHTDTHTNIIILLHIISSITKVNQKNTSSNQIKYNDDNDDDDDKYYHIKSITLMKYHTERYSREI